MYPYREFHSVNMEVDEKRLVFCSTPQEAVEEAHAITVLTEWDEFKMYPYREFYNAMMKPAFLFDGRGILDHRELEGIGFEVHAIGKGRGGRWKTAHSPQGLSTQQQAVHAYDSLDKQRLAYFGHGGGYPLPLLSFLLVRPMRAGDGQVVLRTKARLALSCRGQDVSCMLTKSRL